MSKFRKKPVEIEAVQFKVIEEIPCKNGMARKYNAREISRFMGRKVRIGCKPNGKPEGAPFIEIETTEGNMVASLGDWIIKEPFDKERGFYPCKPEVFEKTYEPVNTTS